MARWTGKTVACIASGPSLTKADCEAVSGLPAIAVNTSWKMALGQRSSMPEIRTGGRNTVARLIPMQNGGHAANRLLRLTRSISTKPEAHITADSGRWSWLSRSGLRGFCSLAMTPPVKHGLHWHGKHESTKNPDEIRCKKWRVQFGLLNRRGAEIINCTPRSELTCFPKMSIAEALETATC